MTNESDVRRRYREALDLVSEIRYSNRLPTREESKKLSDLTSNPAFGHAELMLMGVMSHLRCARHFASEAGAEKTLERVRAAIRSCGGAVRHATAKGYRDLPPS